MSIAEKLTTIAENEQKVFDAGKQAEYDAFWDNYQQNGNRTNYEGLFSFGGWNKHTFKPKYGMQPSYALQMFYHFNKHEDGNATLDLVTLLNDAGVSLDFSKATNMNYCFQSAKVSHIGVIDLSSATSVNTVFANTYWLKKIDKIIVNENNVFDTNCFLNSEVNDIRFEGVLASNLRIISPLNKASITNEDGTGIIDVLSTNLSGKTFTLTLKSSAVTNAFGSTTAQEWTNLIAPKQQAGWTITLV